MATITAVKSFIVQAPGGAIGPLLTFPKRVSNGLEKSKAFSSCFVKWNKWSIFSGSTVKTGPLPHNKILE
jgi:hypothetical protein